FRHRDRPHRRRVGHRRADSDRRRSGRALEWCQRQYRHRSRQLRLHERPAARRRARVAGVVSPAVPEHTVGIDIRTSAVKALVADADGNIGSRSRIPHEFYVPSPLRFEHDAKVAWYDGPRLALDALGDVQPRAVSVAAMVPSLTAVDAEGVPCAPGLLY